MFETVLRTPVPLGSPPLVRTARHSLSWLGALCALGCSSQVTPEYQGEPMAVLHGALASDGDFALPASGDGMMVGLVWLVYSPDREKEPLLAEIARTEGEFPFGFKLSLFKPPTREAQSYECGDPGNFPCQERVPSPVYQGIIAALDGRADLSHVTESDMLGASIEHGVLYFERDENRDDPNDVVATMAGIYNVPALRGYHLYTVRKDQEAYEQQVRCQNNGLCVQALTSSARQAWADRLFQECVSLSPEATTCVSYPESCRQLAGGAVGCESYFGERGGEPSAAELAEHERCEALQEEHWQHDSCDFGRVHEFPGNPLGFDAEISIRMGAGLYEWIR